MHDDEWALFEVDALEDEDDSVPRSAVGYARPVLLDPHLFNPYRPLVDGPSVDDYRPPTHTEGTAR